MLEHIETPVDIVETSLTMANPNYQLLELYVHSIQKFDGNPHTLGLFLNNCEHLISAFTDQNNPSFNELLISIIIGKLTGRASNRELTLQIGNK